MLTTIYDYFGRTTVRAEEVAEQEHGTGKGLHAMWKDECLL